MLRNLIPPDTRILLLFITFLVIAGFSADPTPVRAAGVSAGETMYENDASRVSKLSGNNIHRYETVYGELRQKYQVYLTGAGLLDNDTDHFRAQIEALDAEAEQYRQSMLQDGQYPYLWEYLAEEWGDRDMDDSDWMHYRHVQDNFDYLRTMAMAYKTPGSVYYRDPGLLEEIRYGLNFMAPHYSDTTTVRGNWWQWQIGTPNRVLDINILLYDHISENIRSHYTTAVDYFVPEVVATGANRMDRVAIRILLGLLEEDTKIILEAKAEMATLFGTVSEGSGFYPDGSAIFHSSYPYTMHYQVIELRAIGEVMYLLAGSPWEIGGTDCELENTELIYDWLFKTFQPFIYRGQAMSMVVGRMQTHDVEVSRGAYATQAFLLFGEALPEPHSTKIKSIAKGWITHNAYQDFFEMESNITFLALARTVMEDNSIEPRKPLRMYRQYYNMDRAVFHSTNYAFGISMLSDRISNYSVLNDGRGAVRGWHTSHGMTYLYNNDLTQFNDYFWETVDAYRLPGTTVNRYTEIPSGRRGSKPWAGGVEFGGVYGTSGMHLNPHDKTLEARKSWFLFGEEIVAMGAGITAKDDTVIETIVENRKIRNDAGNTFLVDGRQRLSGQINEEEAIRFASWAHLEGNVPGSDIGYYFPGGSDIIVEKKQVTIDSVGDDYRRRPLATPVTRNYISMRFDHGVNPEDSTYAYVILPNHSVQQTRTYTHNTGIVIIENTADLQAVHHKWLGITGINNWSDKPARVDRISVDRPSSVMYRERDGIFELAISEPTQKGEKITVEIHGILDEMLSKDDMVTVRQTAPVKLEVDMSRLEPGYRGRTVKVRLRLE